MSNIIDISKRITNELPTIKITDELIITVNNRKNTVLSVQAMVKEMEKKSKDDGFDEMALMNKILEMVTSVKNAKAIEELNLPMPEYKLVYQAVMAAIQGRELEDMENNTPT